MARNDDENDDDPLESDQEDSSDDLALMICPHCRRTVTEDTQKCPHCGDWIEPVAPNSGTGRKLIYAGLVVLLVLMILMTWR
jgi:hypothetical protein